VSEPIRSYQRIFAPERRIYQVEGRSLPIPGGVPLRWLAYAVGALLVVLALGSGSVAVPLLAAGIAALAGFGVGGRGGAALAAICGAAGTWLAAEALALIDWPLRLVVVPAAAATLATQATPDGRRADRYARSWAVLRLAPLRRSLGRALPLAGSPRWLGGEVWVSPDERAPTLRRARLGGPAIVFFAAPVAARRVGLGHRRIVARPFDRKQRSTRGIEQTRRLVLAEREALEVRP
jgi:hypothetical protein